MNKDNKYGLFTTIALIIGIVIGSGIYFKSDDILMATNGNIHLGVILLSVCSIGMVSGGLTLAEYAKNGGGLIDYYEKYVNRKMAIAYGNFQFIILIPTLNIVVAWVASIYTFELFDLKVNNYTFVLAYIYIILLTLLNIYSKQMAGFLQNIATIIKIIPLVFVGIISLFIKNNTSIEEISVIQQNHNWMSAILPIMFSYEGWIMATNIAKEVKNPKRNIKLALMISPIIIVVLYIIYFVGLSTILTPSVILEKQDAALSTLFFNLFGKIGEKGILLVVLISIIGVLNGLTLCGIRIVNVLYESKLIKIKAEVNEKYGISIKSAIIYFIIATIWLIIHYITCISNVIPGRDVSEISIIFNYIMYIPLYFSVKGKISSYIAILFSIVIAIMSFLVSPIYIGMFFLISLITTICSVYIIGN